MGNRDQSVDNLETGEKCPPPHVASHIEAGTVVPKIYKRETFNNKIVQAGENTKVTIATNQSSDLAELDEMVKSMMEKSENKCGNPNENRKADRCKVCGKEGKGRVLGKMCVNQYYDQNFLIFSTKSDFDLTTFVTIKRALSHIFDLNIYWLTSISCTSRTLYREHHVK